MATTTKKSKVSVTRFDIADMKEGDVFSEISHYKFKQEKKGVYYFDHLGSGETISLTEEYISDLLNSADQYMREVKVGKEDKHWTLKQLDEWVKQRVAESDMIPANIPRVGDVKVPGIRTIWEEIHSAQVFTVCFQTQSKDMTNKEFEELTAAQLKEAVDLIEKAKTSKKGVATVAGQAIKKIQENPISKVVPGKMRVLRGYKVQFTSRDGKYDCVDMDIAEKNNIRPVNINTIDWLVFNGVRYVVE